MKLKYLMTIALVAIGVSLIAQTFSPPFNGFSRKKTTYITMKDGQEHSVTIKSLGFKKGLIDKMKVVQSSNGKKVKITPEDISHMYVPPSAFAKIGQALNAATDLTKIQDGELDAGHLDEGYLYMESANVQVKKRKTQYCMLQVMNPTFSKNIKVYNDPFAGESIGLNAGPMKVAGGLAKSYYIKKAGEDVAKRIKKKEYKKDIDNLFSECPAVLKKYSADPRWDEFEEFIVDYSTMCK